MNEKENPKGRKDYETPSIEVIEMQTEGILAASNLENPFPEDPTDW